jgi:hypothetical protein
MFMASTFSQVPRDCVGNPPDDPDGIDRAIGGDDCPRAHCCALPSIGEGSGGLLADVFVGGVLREALRSSLISIGRGSLPQRWALVSGVVRSLRSRRTHAV